MIVPCIDLMDGKVVQLQQGEKLLMAFDDPIGYLEKFSVFGTVSVIDLDAAMGKGSNFQLIQRMCRLRPCIVGGGIRDVALGKAYLKAGARKIIVGTKATPEFLAHFRPEQVLAALDTFNGELVTHGWKEKRGGSVLDRVAVLNDYVSGFSCTFVDTEGTNQGIDLNAVKKLKASIVKPLIVAGGIASYQEVNDLDRMGVNCFVGRSIYEGQLTLEDSFCQQVQYNADGLVPAIVKNEFGEVLMLGYCNEASLRQTLASKKVTFWSRSRQEIWVKGATSGNELHLKSIHLDCDRDALLIKAEAVGPTCHLNTKSCFDDFELGLSEMHERLASIASTSSGGSYTAELVNNTKLNAAKITEEAQELIEANTEDEIIHEAADLIYHMQTFLISKKVSFKSVLKELEGRKKPEQL